MARKRTDMRKIKDDPGLKFELGLSHREIGQYLSLGSSTDLNNLPICDLP